MQAQTINDTELFSDTVFGNLCTSNLTMWVDIGLLSECHIVRRSSIADVTKSRMATPLEQMKNARVLLPFLDLLKLSKNGKKTLAVFICSSGGPCWI
jgi:hypothetical protein